MRLQNKVAVITGGASGMGRATTLRFSEGASVVIADFNEDTGKQTMALAANPDPRAGPLHPHRCRQRSDVAAMIALAVSDFGRLDIVFNNAGLGGALGPIWDVEVKSGTTPSTRWPRGLSRHQARGACDEAFGPRRVHHKYGFGRRPERRRRPVGLLGGQGGGHQSDPRGRASARCRSHQGQCDLSRRNLTPLTDRGDPAAAAKRLDEFQPWPEHGQPETSPAPLCSWPAMTPHSYRRGIGSGWWIDRRRSGHLSALRRGAGSPDARGRTEPWQYRRDQHSPADDSLTRNSRKRRMSCR